MWVVVSYMNGPSRYELFLRYLVCPPSRRRDSRLTLLHECQLINKRLDRMRASERASAERARQLLGGALAGGERAERKDGRKEGGLACVTGRRPRSNLY